MGLRFLHILGFVIGQGQRKLEHSKIVAIKSFPKPCTKAQIRSFLGLTGYYKDFIPDFASHSYHLTYCTKKAAPDNVQWNNNLDSEYSYLQSACALSLPFIFQSLVMCCIYRQMPLVSVLVPYYLMANNFLQPTTVGS